MQFETIETPSLLLKALSPQYMKHIFENHSDEEIKMILGHQSEKDFLDEKDKYQDGYFAYDPSFKKFLMTDKESGTTIGRCGFHNWNKGHRRAEIGYTMTNENYKRKGFMTEAAEAIIEYGFNKMNLHRIEALVGPANVPSLRIMEKFNFVKEGILREHHLTADKFENSFMFSKLHHEFVKEKL
ncbi:MAG: GCN5-related N-acetyltransferase [Bacteroidetes bacterium]|jgi:ribosomal-protein-alanine N-acetyltransferase|nr:GCN5-related N-acetyltransferase [Bacteroidota bacterium]